MLVAFFVTGLLVAGAFEREIEGSPLGASRTVKLALLRPMTALSSALRLDRPRLAIDTALGRTGGERHTIEELGKQTTPHFPREITGRQPLRLLVIGDSMAMVFGHSLVNQAEATGYITAKLSYRVSSGLSRPDFFDWPQHMINLIVEWNPDAVVVMFGANDGQDVLYNGQVLKVGSAEWKRIYQGRVANAMVTLSKDARKVYWVGNPVMREAGFRERIKMMNGIYGDQAKKHPGAQYIDLWRLFSGPNGEYVDYLRDGDGDRVLMRGKDGVHFTQAGGDRAAAEVLKAIGQEWKLPGYAP